MNLNKVQKIILSSAVLSIIVLLVFFTPWRTTSGYTSKYAGYIAATTQTSFAPIWKRPYGNADVDFGIAGIEVGIFIILTTVGLLIFKSDTD